MAQHSQISASIPDNVLQDVYDHLRLAKAALAPYLVTLTVEQRISLFKMSDKSVAFVDKVQGYMNLYPEFIPGYLDMSEFNNDHILNKALQPALTLSSSINMMIDDSVMASGSDLMNAATTYYNNVRDAAHKGVPNAKLIYEDLKQRFPGRTPKDGTETTQ